MVGPAVITSLTDVEERSLALESRAFSRPGRRYLLWSMPDSGRERVLRLVLVLVLVLAVLVRVVGLSLPVGG